MAASVGSIAVLSAVPPHRASGGGERSTHAGDSIAAVLHDTLRLMRVISDGDHRYAFVVDGARWAPGPSTVTARTDDQLAPLLRVARDSN